MLSNMDRRSESACRSSNLMFLASGGNDGVHGAKQHKQLRRIPTATKRNQITTQIRTQNLRQALLSIGAGDSGIELVNASMKGCANLLHGNLKQKQGV